MAIGTFNRKEHMLMERNDLIDKIEYLYGRVQGVEHRLEDLELDCFRQRQQLNARSERIKQLESRQATFIPDPPIDPTRV